MSNLVKELVLIGDNKESVKVVFKEPLPIKDGDITVQMEQTQVVIINKKAKEIIHVPHSNVSYVLRNFDT